MATGSNLARTLLSLTLSLWLLACSATSDGAEGSSGGVTQSSGGALTTGGASGLGGKTESDVQGGRIAGDSGGGTSTSSGAAGEMKLGGRGGAGGTAGDATGGSSDDPLPTTFSPCPDDDSPCRLMPLGDSITFGGGSTDGAGYRRKLFELALAQAKRVTFVGSLASGPMQVGGQPFPRRNEGHSGAPIDDISAHAEEWIAACQPHIITLHIGTNDMKRDDLDWPHAPARLERLIDKILAAAPGSLLVVAQIIPSSQLKFDQRIVAYNAAIPELVKKRALAGKHVLVVDMHTAFEKNNGFAENYMHDVLHPKDAGYDVMAATWYQALNGVL